MYGTLPMKKYLLRIWGEGQFFAGLQKLRMRLTVSRRCLSHTRTRARAQTEFISLFHTSK